MILVQVRQIKIVRPRIQVVPGSGQVKLLPARTPTKIIRIVKQKPKPPPPPPQPQVRSEYCGPHPRGEVELSLTSSWKVSCIFAHLHVGGSGVEGEVRGVFRLHSREERVVLSLTPA